MNKWTTDDSDSDLDTLIADALAATENIPEIPKHAPVVKKRKVKAEIILPDRAPGYLEPWAQQSDEPDMAFRYFRQFRDMGPTRTNTAVAEHFDINPNSLSRYTGVHNWRDRAKAYDDHMDRVYRAELEVQVREMADIHASTISDGLKVLALPFAAIQRKLEDDPDALDELSLSSMRQLMDLSIKVARVMPAMTAAERTARGLPSEIRRVEGTIEHEHIHYADRSQISEVIRALESAGQLDDRRGAIEPAEVVDPEDD